MADTFINNLVVYTGTDFDQTFVLESEHANSALNLDGYTGSCSMKKFAATTTSTDFTVAFTNRSLGKVRISMASTISDELKPGRYYYDLLLNDGVETTRVIEGQVIVKKPVTRI